MNKLILIIIVSLVAFSCKQKKAKPRVIICTDININSGDPDDRQSMVHLLMYANEVDIVSLIPERLNAGGVEACMLAIDAYEKDYLNSDYNFRKLNYPEPAALRSVVQTARSEAIQSIITAANTTKEPIHILVWGNMKLVYEALNKAPDIADKIRIYTIGTHRMAQNIDAATNSNDTVKYGIRNNWNGPGRNKVYNDKRFDKLWWLENDWAYNGMFEGLAPRDLLLEIKEYGALGYHMWEVVQSYKWAHYFRAGDTPTLLYLLEPGVEIDNPSTSTWAGKFIKPYPETRPNYWIDDAGIDDWDYENPQNTWNNAKQVYDYRVNMMVANRDNMYAAYKQKMKKLYNIK